MKKLRSKVIAKPEFSFADAPTLVETFGLSPTQIKRIHTIEDTFEHSRRKIFSVRKKYIWQTNCDKKALFVSEEMRLAAIRWLVFHSDGNLKNITKADFESNGISELLEYYHRNVYWAFVAVGYAYSISDTIKHSESREFDNWKIYPWEAERTPRGVYLDKRIRIAAVNWLLRNTLDVRTVLREDFINVRLGGLLATYYHDQPYLALVEANRAYSPDEIKSMAETGQFGDAKIYPWEMNRTPDIIFNDPTLKKSAMQWLAWVCRKDYRNLDFEDFKKYLRGLTATCSAFEALLEVGLVTEGDRTYMSRNRPTYARNVTFGKLSNASLQ